MASQPTFQTGFRIPTELMARLDEIRKPRGANRTQMLVIILREAFDMPDPMLAPVAKRPPGRPRKDAESI